MVKGAVLTAVLAGVFATAAIAGTLPPTLKATAKGNDVRITNGSSQTFKGFFINSTDSPKITGSSNSACKPGKSKPYTSGGKSHVDYYLTCSFSVAAGKSVDVKLTMSGSGTVWVWATGTNGVQSKIATGN